MKNMQSLVYSMVARGEVVLAEYSAFPTASASFASLAASCLPNLRRSSSSSASSSSATNTNNEVISYTCHFLIHDHFTYLVVSDNSEGREIALDFLHRIKEDFYKRYGDATINNEMFKVHSLNDDFGPRLKEHMQYCIDNFQNLKKLPSIKDQILEVTEIVAENVEKECLELKVDNNEILQTHAENFHRQGKQLKKEMWIRQVKFRLLVFIISTILSLSIWLSICKGIRC